MINNICVLCLHLLHSVLSPFRSYKSKYACIPSNLFQTQELQLKQNGNETVIIIPERTLERP